MEPWEIKDDDTRKENSKKLFIIFCEDGAVEPTYFEFFKREDLQVSAIGDAKKHHAQIDYITEYFREKDLLEVNSEGHEVLKLDDGAQVWCVFDRDKEPGDKKDSAFNDSIVTANSKGIKTAWSNDDFELWILLHFEDVDPEDKNYLNRSKYYERLTEILQNGFPNEISFKNPRFNYYDAMKKKRPFISFTYQLMKGKTNDAIERAKKLESHHCNGALKPTHLHCPCTKVHHLIMELSK